MKASIAIAIAAVFATGTAFAQSVQPQNKSAPVKVASQQVAQAGGAAAGAGEAAGTAVGTELSGTAIVAIGAGTALVIGASGSNSTTSH